MYLLKPIFIKCKARNVKPLYINVPYTPGVVGLSIVPEWTELCYIKMLALCIHGSALYQIYVVCSAFVKIFYCCIFSHGTVEYSIILFFLFIKNGNNPNSGSPYTARVNCLFSPRGMLSVSVQVLFFLLLLGSVSWAPSSSLAKSFGFPLQLHVPGN